MLTRGGGQTASSTPAVDTPDNLDLHLAALGVISPRGGVTAVTPAESVRSAVVSRLLVVEGQSVATGDPVAVLDTLPRATADLAGAEAEVRGKAAALAQAKLTFSQNAADARAAVTLAEAQLAQSERSLARARQLTPANAISRASVEDLETDVEVRRAQLEQALARQEGLAMPVEQSPDVLAAIEALRAAEASHDLAKIALGEATVRAPFSGTVLSVEARIGEPVSGAGIVRLAADGPVEAELEVHQDRIAEVAVGATVTLRAPALDKPLSGRVVAIGKEVQRQAVFDADPAANTDSRVLAIRVELDTASSALARSLIGLQVVADIARTGATK